MKEHHGHGGGKGCHGGHHGHGWRLRVHPHGHIDHQGPGHHRTRGGHHIQSSGCGGCHSHDGNIVGHHGGHHAHKFKGPHDHRGGCLSCHGRKHHKHGGHGRGYLGCHGKKHHNKHGGHGKRHRCHHVDHMVVNRNTTPEIDAITEGVLQIGWTDAASPEIGAIAGEIPSDAS